ncbi:hypothetical protein DUNSADRAFT_2889 [Dunaliella salina]|uniref:Guanylate cyclase domain-containing protein n=1 Tax=Dunaliella salina TaxID=3046 RepID=A0ABQ7GUY2_DUNSA|nr:hypothetical protein DUNSADRAFT_2889 [Dunaliella salina]|eukprot:KAF5838421.1 hypothetical protein DUNSADRAFT_2889 [Dunaliella salina]
MRFACCLPVRTSQYVPSTFLEEEAPAAPQLAGASHVGLRDSSRRSCHSSPQGGTQDVPTSHALENPPLEEEVHGLARLHLQSAAPEHVQHSSFSDTLQSQLVEAIPYAVAITTSDGVNVLHHRNGSEPAAARALHQALQQRHHASAARDLPKTEAGSEACSFLKSLLGPKMADDALSRVRNGRSWKGSISMQLQHDHVSSSPGELALAAAVAQNDLKGSDVALSRSVSDLPTTKSTSHQVVNLQGAELKDPVGSLEASPRGKESKGVRRGSLHAEMEAKKEAGQEVNILHKQSKAASKPSSKGRVSFDPAPDASHGRQSCEGGVLSSEPHQMGDTSAPGLFGSCPAYWNTGMEHYVRAAAKKEGVQEASKQASPSKMHRSKSSSSINRPSRRTSLLLSDKAIEKAILESDETNNTRTAALLKSLSQAENASPKSSFDRGQGSLSLERGYSLPDTPGSVHPPILETERRGTASWENSPDGTRTSVSMDGLELHSFDIAVSQLKPNERERSPLLVLISSSSEHVQVQAVLSTLAESQLALLSSIMPQHAIQFLALESLEAVPKFIAQLARAHTGVTLLFMDIVNFTSMSKNVEPESNNGLTDIYGVHKVETAGDCYIVSGGIMSPRHSTKEFGLVVEDQDPVDSAKRVMEFAKAALEAAQQVRMPDTQEPVRVRVGMHTGNVVSGLIGSKLPKFSIFGDAMNTASRMLSTGVPGRIHVSDATHRLLSHSEWWESTGGAEVKGKGRMQTYLWLPQPFKQTLRRRALQVPFNQPRHIDQAPLEKGP